MRTVAKRIKQTSRLESLGWLGMALFLFSYLLVVTGTLKTNSYAYHLMNVAAAFAYTYFSYKRGVYQSVIANAIYALIGIYAIAGLIL